MNVAGAGLGGVIGGLIVLMFIIPLLVVLICINLGYFRSHSRINRVLRYIGLYVLALAIEMILPWTLLSDFLSFFVWIFGFALLLVIITFILSYSKPATLLRVRRIVGIAVMLTLPTIYFFIKTPKPHINPLFEKEVAKALDLSLISRDSLYNASHLVIVGDTAAGFYEGNYVERWEDGGPSYVSSGYFMKSLTDSTFQYYWDRKGYNLSDYSMSYSDSSIILYGDSGGKLIRRIYSDTTESNGFVYKGGHFHTAYRIIYKNLQIIGSQERFLVFDEVTQTLVLDKPAKLLNTLLGNSLLFVEKHGKKTSLNYLDLDQLKVTWSRPINVVLYEGPARTTNRQDLYITDKYFVVKAVDAACVLERKTGLTKWKYRWHSSPVTHENFVMIDTSRLFLSDGRLLKSFDLTTGKQNWILKNATLLGLHSKFVIAWSIDQKWLLIIDKSSGKILTRIRRSDTSLGIRLIGDYVVVQSGKVTGIYR